MPSRTENQKAYNRQWRLDHLEHRNKYMKKYYKKNGYRKQLPDVCETLRKHYNETKNDPEGLSCDFIRSIIGIGEDCK